VARRKIGPWYRLAVIVLKPLMLALTRKNWRGAENLPEHGGFIAVTNHISYMDSFTFGHFMYDNGYLPRFLTKESVFRAPVIGRVVSGAEQIPVYRETADASVAYSAAVAAVQRGECVAIYPEGTLTRDPDLWPMRGKTGAVRIALATGCPIIPVAQWGAQQILPGYAHRPRLWPRHESYVSAGPPVDLSRFSGQPMTAELLIEATEQVTSDLTALLAEIRQEPAPQPRWDPRVGGRPGASPTEPADLNGAADSHGVADSDGPAGLDDPNDLDEPNGPADPAGRTAHGEEDR
jgi:1-acyl-sn-glycerol-3-phosphate acyltransferase